VIEVTGSLQLAAWQNKVTPPIEQVRSTVWSIPIDCAEFSIRYTFAYLVIGDGGKFVLIDPGHATELGFQQLSEGLAAAGLRFDDLVGTIVTHYHVDHIGGVSEVARASDAWFGMHAAEVGFFTGWPDPREVIERDHRMIDSFGAPQHDGRKVRLDPESYSRIVPAMLPDRLIADRDIIDLPGRHLEAVWTPGHTPGHLSIVDHDEGLVFTGDHMLPRITSNVSAYHSDLEHDALGDYYSSLDAIIEWNDFEACPAHEYRFIGLAERAEELRAHHAARADQVRAVLQEGTAETVWDVAQRLEWRHGWDSLEGTNLRGALGETKAHMTRLLARSSN
jgi:glyoxylase-like metal-dependent hydrolase (beta-lactamase superfamily II)